MRTVSRRPATCFRIALTVAVTEGSKAAIISSLEWDFQQWITSARQGGLPLDLQETELNLAEAILIFEIIPPTSDAYVGFGVAVFAKQAFCILVEFLAQCLHVVCLIVDRPLKSPWLK